MANVEYLICSFCQGPSSRSLRQKLAPHLSNPACHIRPSDLDWLDKWRLLLPSHVEWDLPLLQDSEFQNEYEAELPKTNVVAKVMWVPSIEGKISDTPEWDDLDGWRTIEFRPRRRAQQQQQQQQTSSVRVTDGYEHLLPPAGGGGISKRTLHAYNDDIEATRLPFHSACLRMLYEACNEVMYSTYATSTVSDVVSAILLPSWREGDVNMDWLSRHRSQLSKQRLIVPWGESWHPLDPQTNFLAVDPSRPTPSHRVQSILIRQPSIPNVVGVQPPLLQMPAEVLDLISDFLMQLDTSTPRPYDPNLDKNCRSLQSLRHTCRKMYHHSFPRIHFLSFLHSECRRHRTLDHLFRKSPPNPNVTPVLTHFQYQIHINHTRGPYLKPLLPYRRIPSLPPYSATDSTVLETDWESMYRGWKEGLGWVNRARSFARCEVWLGDLQEFVWMDKEWGRTANYIIPAPRQEEEEGVANVALVGGEEDEEMIDAAIENAESATVGDLDQFQWP